MDNDDKRYLLCDYNRDGDSYRSPWSNQYVPSLPIGPDGEGGLMPSSTLRELEVRALKIFAKKKCRFIKRDYKKD